MPFDNASVMLPNVFTPTPGTELRANLEKLRALLATPDRWCKNYLVCQNGHAHCLMGAINVITCGQSTYLLRTTWNGPLLSWYALVETLAAYVPASFDDPEVFTSLPRAAKRLVLFNNADIVFHRDILALIDTAIQAA